MHRPSRLRFLIVAAVITILAGCSRNIAFQNVTQSAGGSVSPTNRILGEPSQTDRFDIAAKTGHLGVSYNSCPATGPIEYLSDQFDNVINVYAGNFAGQFPCGQIASGSGLYIPIGLYVKTSTHDLYVANYTQISVFHRGETSPYNVYTDSLNQVVQDVAVANDGTVIASNLEQVGGPERGSISTWIGGPSGGTYVGNFPMTNSYQGKFITVKKNGTVFYDDIDGTTGKGDLWFVSCPAGVCGVQTQVAGVSFDPGGMASDEAGELLVVDQFAKLDVFKLPDPNPKKFSVTKNSLSIAIDDQDRHRFIAYSTGAAEYYYPYTSSNLVGTVPGNYRGQMVGIAFDP